MRMSSFLNADALVQPPGQAPWPHRRLTLADVPEGRIACLDCGEQLDRLTWSFTPCAYQMARAERELTPEEAP